MPHVKGSTAQKRLSKKVQPYRGTTLGIAILVITRYHVIQEYTTSSNLVLTSNMTATHCQTRLLLFYAWKACRHVPPDADKFFHSFLMRIVFLSLPPRVSYSECHRRVPPNTNETDNTHQRPLHRTTHICGVHWSALLREPTLAAKRFFHTILLHPLSSR